MNRTRVMRATIFTSVVLATLAMAERHLTMIDSRPVAETTVSTIPDTIQLWFSQDLEPTINRIALEGPTGEVKLGKTEPAAGDGSSMMVPVAETLSDGTYTVSWRAAGNDGHPVRGRFRFNVESGR